MTDTIQMSEKLIISCINVKVLRLMSWKIKNGEENLEPRWRKQQELEKSVRRENLICTLRQIFR
jgi:hypothetical protein